MVHSLFWTPLHAQIDRSLKHRQILPRGSRVLIAVSGGQDSLCLAKLCLDLQPKWEWSLAIAHCDHQWQADSQTNVKQVQELAQTWQLPFYLKTATQLRESEAEARTWRYQSLIEIARDRHYQIVVTGHTASDRAETLLYNLVRGSGADGLQSLTWKRPLTNTINLVRPLLEVSRQQTLEFCQQLNLPVWQDATNQDLKYARNRIRQDLIPYLQQHFNPQADKHLAQTAELLQADITYLEESATKIRLEAQHQSERAIHRLVLKSAPLALQRRVIRQFLSEVLPHSPNFQQIEKVMRLIDAPNRSQTDPFPGGAIAKVEHPWIQVINP